MRFPCAASVAAGLRPALRRQIAHLEVFRDIDSTHDYLLGRARAGVLAPSLCIAGRQRQGRGRAGHVWVSPPGNLYLSLLWPLRSTTALSGLSLLAAVYLARYLEALGVPGIGVKWPNDLWWENRKLGGILLETGGAMQHWIVMGVGINHTMPSQAADAIGQPWVDLAHILGPRVPDLNALAAGVTTALTTALQVFGRTRLETLAGLWPQYDVLLGRWIHVQTLTGPVRGRAAGIDSIGRLQVDTPAKQLALTSGDVSLVLGDDPAA